LEHADADDLDRRFTAELDRPARERAATPVADTTMFLSHHWPSRYDRCAVIGGRHVCRRCLVLYPVAIGVALLAGLAVTWPGHLDPWVLWLAPLPGVVEFSLDALGVIRHHPLRQSVVSALLAVAYGKLLWRYAHDPGDALAWSVVVVDCGICLVAALVGRRLAAVDGGAGTGTGTGTGGGGGVE
jgi:hypothetical protein